LKLAKKVTFEHAGGIFRFYNSERFQSFLTMRIIISSKSKVKNPSNFFPKLNVFKIDKNNKAKLIGELELKLYKASNLNIVYLEQIYNYQEKETFVAYLAIDLPIKEKIVVCATKSGDNNFQVTNVIGMIK
jgi:hypothetical protein